MPTFSNVWGNRCGTSGLCRMYAQKKRLAPESVDGIMVFEGVKRQEADAMELSLIHILRYQYGEGCLSDQILGQFLAFEAGMGYLLPEDHVKKALKSIVNYNFVYRAKDFPHVQRAYILNDEKGLTPVSYTHLDVYKRQVLYLG